MSFARTEAITGHGGAVGHSATANGTFVKIDGSRNVALPDRELEVAEITNDDTPDNHKDYIPALIDPGTVDFEYIYGKTAFALVDTLFQARTQKYWRVVLPDASTAVFPGFMTKHGLPGAGQGDEVVCECSIQATGKIVYTATPA